MHISTSTTSCFGMLSRGAVFVASFGLIVLPMLTFGATLALAAETGGSDPTQSNFQLVPCDGVKVECNYNQFIVGIQRIIKACIIFAVPLTAIVFATFGFKIMTAGGNVKQREEGIAGMKKVMLGFLVMLGAWYAVDLVLGGLLDPSFKSGLVK